jgi:hypothetical protein
VTSKRMALLSARRDLHRVYDGAALADPVMTPPEIRGNKTSMRKIMFSPVRKNVAASQDAWLGHGLIAGKSPADKV